MKVKDVILENITIPLVTLFSVLRNTITSTDEAIINTIGNTPEPMNS
jgi:hypothetical protein